jgi:hypothetical protein
MVTIGIACHLWARRIILRSRYLALKICVPPLLMLLVVALFVIITATFSGFYSTSYGYQLQPGEPSGPLGTMGDLIGVLSSGFTRSLCGPHPFRARHRRLRF